jgi:hypothetical protein
MGISSTCQTGYIAPGGFYFDVAFFTYPFQLLIVWHLNILFGAQPRSF